MVARENKDLGPSLLWKLTLATTDGVRRVAYIISQIEAVIYLGLIGVVIYLLFLLAQAHSALPKPVELPRSIYIDVSAIIAVCIFHLIHGRKIRGSVLTAEISSQGFRGKSWKDYDAWLIKTDRRHPGLMRIEVLQTKKRLWVGHSFDPVQIKEVNLRNIMEHYMPGKEETGQ